MRNDLVSQSTPHGFCDIVIWNEHFLPYINQKKCNLSIEIDIFLTFMFINFLVQTLQCAASLIIYLFCKWKY